MLVSPCYGASSTNQSSTQKRFDAIESLFQNFKQKTNDEATALMAQNVELKNQVNSISARLNSAEQEIAELKAAQTQSQHLLESRAVIISPVYLEKLRGMLNFVSFYAFQYRFLIAACAVLALLLLFRKPRKREDQVEPNIITSDDYDFLGSKDGGVTKLDLARTYLAMGDKENAHKLLKEVIDYGNSEQKKEAKALLDL